MNKNLFATILIGGSVVIGALGTVVVATASTASSLVERYNNTSVPSRSDLLSRVPGLPTQFPLDPTVARQQGARELQGLNPNQALNPDRMGEQLGRINSESANPQRLAGNIPSGASSLGSRVLNTQSNPTATTGTPSAAATNSPSDPLGQDPAAAARQQSSVTRSGTLPNGALNVSGGDPLGLANTLSRLASTDIGNASENYLSSLLAMKLQVLNTQTTRLAAKVDLVNEDHATLNRNIQSLADTMNEILKQLPTLPQN